jgi:hypothetical protein
MTFVTDNHTGSRIAVDPEYGLEVGLNESLEVCLWVRGEYELVMTPAQTRMLAQDLHALLRERRGAE